MAGQLITRGKDKWLLRVYTGRDGAGKRRYFNHTFHGSKREADRYLRSLQTRHDSGERLGRRVLTLNHFLDRWLEGTSQSWRPRTLLDYTQTLGWYVRPHIGTHELAGLAPVDVAGLISTLSGLGLSPRTVRKAREVLRNALGAALDEGLIASNPARNSRLVTSALPALSRVERTTVGAHKLADFNRAAAESPLGALFALLLYSGLRPSEALALRWSDFRDGKVFVTRAMVDKPGLAHAALGPKTLRSARAVPLPHVSTSLLASHRRLQLSQRLRMGPLWEDQDLMFPDSEGRPLRQHRLSRPFRTLLGLAGLPHMRLYDLRHSCATLLAESGEDLNVVKDRLGHSTITLTANTYAHVTHRMQGNATATFDRLASQCTS